MKQINCNVSGTPTDTPTIFDDAGESWSGSFELGNLRCVFRLPDHAVGGGHLRWLDVQYNFLLPANPGSYEGASLGLPTIKYAPPLSSVFPFKGATEFNLPAWMRAGHEDITAIVRQRTDAGATWLRSLSGGYPFRTDQAWLTMSEHQRYWDLCLKHGARVFQCAFANTAIMPGADQLSWQLAYWEQLKATAAPYGSDVALQLCNEWNHSTQRIDPSKFGPSSANLCDHGPGLTDAHPVEPFWSLVTWHAHRETSVNGTPSARAIAECDCYSFEHLPWPKGQPWIVGEMAKPEDYGFNPAYAADLGRSCGKRWGGFFHSNEGVQSLPWRPEVERCARAFYEAMA